MYAIFEFAQAAAQPNDSKGLNVTTGNNMIFDHISVEWARYDNIGLTSSGSYNITIQNSICGESINTQYAGAFIDSSDNITFSHNLFLDNKTRNPKAKGTIQYINNVVYNWGARRDWWADILRADHYLDCIRELFYPRA